MQENTKTRAFRLPPSLDDKLEERSKELGFMRPSDYIRELVRKDLYEKIFNTKIEGKDRNPFLKVGEKEDQQ